eukprot:TRINITY_DN11318_c0_g1_i1.p2 TRINITY_DN11318_c0_g1~~TRINITY_DN11318_c0_g1_i1.p2  ORF type:complete len:194 (+),score=30.51 TRINITY_DN11318_c0_g1_i1:210-791(+)
MLNLFANLPAQLNKKNFERKHSDSHFDCDNSSDHSSISTNEDSDYCKPTIHNHFHDLKGKIKGMPIGLRIDAPAFGESNHYHEDVKFKTELCKNWDEFGDCPYKTKCRFAHGREELRQKVDRRQTKKTCLAFRKSGACSYGTRCIYLHKKRNIEDVRAKSFFSNLLQIPEIIIKNPDSGRKRLSVFEKLGREE